jgi:AcrR family transcriptional regulator
MTLFWQHGYEGTSVADLASTMGINPPSLYAAFGNKEDLFREAVRLYDETEGAAARAALTEEVTARAAIEAVLRTYAEAYPDPSNPTGCMIVLAGTNYAPGNAEVHEFLARWRRADREAFEARIGRGIAEGDVPAEVDAAALAAFVTATLHGMAVQARDGAPRATLDAIVDRALTAWPEEPGPRSSPPRPPGAGQARSEAP